jgi:hypothetical protein
MRHNAVRFGGRRLRGNPFVVSRRLGVSHLEVVMRFLDKLKIPNGFRAPHPILRHILSTARAEDRPRAR